MLVTMAVEFAGSLVRGERFAMDARRPALLVLAAVAGLTVSVYLAAYQLGLLASVWDPLFGAGSERVLTSTVSRLLPVPDAAVGAAAYAVDALLGIALLAGGERAPIRVAVALALVASLGACVAVVLVVLQPLVARSLCSLCLVSAALSVGLAVGAVSHARDRLSLVRSSG